MKNTLIIGTTGYLGPAIIEYMKNEGLTVFTVNRRQPEVTSDGDFIIESIVETPDKLEKIIVKNNITTIVNLAWVGSYGDARFDSKLQMSNLQLTKVLVSLASKYKFHLITTGTISEFIMNNNNEQVSEYAKAKAIIHDYVHQQSKIHEFPYTWAVFGNVFGGHDTTNRFVSNTIEKLTNNETISINTNGEQLFYPLFINDLKRFLSIIIRHELLGERILSDSPIMLKDFVLKSKELINSQSKVNFGEKVELTAKISVDKSTFCPDYSIDEAIKLTRKALEAIK